MKGFFFFCGLFCYFLAGMNFYMWWERDCFVWVNFLSIIVLGLGGNVLVLASVWERNS